MERRSKMEDKKQSGFLKGLLIGIVATCLIAGFLWIGVNSDITLFDGTNFSSDKNKQEKVDSVSAQVSSKLKYLEDLIEEQYLFDYEDEDLEAGIYKGFLSALNDPYTSYYTEEEYKALMESSAGEYSGIGVVVSQNVETGVVTLVEPYEDGPGYKAGILPNDILFAVEGEEVTGQDINSIVSKIKGPDGTVVNITVYRSSEDKYIDMAITREKIEVKTVESKMLDNNIGYILVSEFDSVTYDQYVEAITNLKEQGMEGLIVDLRNNPGGNLDIVVKMADEMLPEGKIVYTKDKHGKGSEWLSDADRIYDKPLVVLVNENSASASEIFAAAIQDYQVGTLVGTTTFGKGIVQVIKDLKDGTAIKMTVSRYYTPKGECIHGIGVTPDVEVELPEELKNKLDISQEEDTQLQKGIEVLKEQMK